MISTEIEEKLHKNRIIVIDTDVNDTMASEVMKRLLAMDDDGHQPIKLYINSPGGSVTSGWQIIDTMNSIRSQVITINTGLCASMGAVILSSGSKRMSLPHARVMIHQVSSGTSGKVFDMRAAFEETETVNRITMTELARNCGKTYDELIGMTNVDKWMSAEEAVEFGIVDEITGNAERKAWKEKEAA